MAMNLLDAGHDVTVYNRTAKKPSRLREGARAAPTAAEASGETLSSLCSPTILPSKASLRRVQESWRISARAIHISSSTISVDLSRKLAAAHAKTEPAASLLLRFSGARKPPRLASSSLSLLARTMRSTAARLCLRPSVSVLLCSRMQPEIANLVKLSGNFLIASVTRVAQRSHGARRQSRNRPT